MAPSFVTNLARGGDAPALVFADGWALTYAELARRVDRQAERFGAAKRLVAVEARASEHAIVAYLAALKAGHAVALLPPDDTAAAERFEADFRPDCWFRLVDGRWRTEAAVGARSDDLHPNDLHRDLALLLSTSGSTGLSRWVRLSAANLEANATAIAGYLELQPSDRAALILPLHYCYGLSVLHAHLVAGASVYVAGRSILDADFVTDLRRNRCTNLAGVPYSYELLERIGFRDQHLPDLRFMTVAGGRLPPDMVARYHTHLSREGKRFFVMYGQTEATSRIAFVPPARLADNTDRIGIAIPGGELRLVDDHGRTIEAAETPGELVYRGPNVMMGYAAGRADLARGTEVADLRTGDLAVRDREGFYRITGRLRRMSKIAGLRIGHDALEQVLARHGIEAAVVGDDRSVVAVFVSGRPEESVRRLLVEASGLAPFHVKVRAVAALPRLESGKVDYERLKAGLEEPARRTDDVRAVFRQAFFPHPVREGDSFASLGGDSLRYVQLTLGLERALGHLPARWEQRPVAELAALRREKRATQTLGTDLVLRALAVLLVVVHHATHWPIPIGAPTMVMLIGYSLARFQSNALFVGDIPRVLRPLLSVLVPYYLIVAGYAIAWGEVPWASVLLVANFGFADPRDHTMLPFLYWFVEVFVQLMLIWTTLFLVPPVRRFARRDPFAFGLAFLAAAMAARFALPLLWPMIGGRQIFTIPWVLYLAIFGWCAVFADTPRRKLTLLAAGLVVFPLVAYFGGNWTGSWVRYMAQLLGLAALLYVPRLRLPQGGVALVLPIAAASYHIYLFHRFAPELVLQPLEQTLPQPLFTVTAIVAGVAVGLLAHEIQKALVNRLAASKATLWLAQERASA